MNPLAHLADTVGTLVHPDARGEPIDAATHRVFIASRIALSLGSLALAPLCLVFGAAPAAWEAVALAWLALPFAAALHVSRSGGLRAGEALSLAAWIGLGITVSLGTGSVFGLSLLVMVPVEAATISATGTALAGLLGAALAALALALAHQVGSTVPATITPLGVAALLAALGYGGVLALGAGRIGRMRREAARADQDRYRALAEVIDDVVLEFDRSGAACNVGCASQRLFGIAPQDLGGRGFFERLHVADRPVFLKLVADVAADARSGTATLRLRTGRTLPSQRGAFDEPVFAAVDLLLRAPPHRGTEGGGARPVAATGLMRDVSARVEQERLVAVAQASSDRTHAGRDMFLANVSHELRTPLNAIIGFAEMLASEALMPADAGRQREYAGIIHQSGLHLLAVVNGILDASKIESGSFDIFPEPFDLAALIHLCCDIVGLKAEQTGVRLAREVAPGAEELVADKRACKQIVLNLLSNALKFTPAGGRVAIAARPDGNSILIIVSDTGVGIAARDLPRLGDPFFQAHASYDRPNDGTGLGLSVVRGLVGLHGGGIVIESAPEHGTRVTVRLPADCRRIPAAPGAVTKIETISRYGLSVRLGDMPSGGRMQKIA